MATIRQRQHPTTSADSTRKSRRRRRKKGQRRDWSIIVAFFTVFFVCVFVIPHAFNPPHENDAPSAISAAVVNGNSPVMLMPGGGGGGQQKQAPPPKMENHDSVKTYDHWKNIATDLATLTAPEILEQLESQDPFGTRRFERDLIQEESKLGRNLNIDEIKQIFSCPVDRITLPDQRNHDKAEAFRRADKGTFLFFQHLRKAGGTHFCSLAEKNLPKKALPSYFCMPDFDKDWSGGTKAGYLHLYPNDEIARRIAAKGHRIAGNEWEQFRLEKNDNHFDLPAVFATSFRKPLDRALSQFRFECIEDRGCHIKDVHVWWEKRADLQNVYTWTFSDTRGKLKQLYHANDKRSAIKRAEMVEKALDTVAKFNIVLAMEWLAYAGPQVSNILGFQNTEQLTHRVRPHIAQAKRDDGQEENKMGSASIAKASWDPKTYLDAAQYKVMSESLALDEILTDAARRMFLERLVCSDL